MNTGSIRWLCCLAGLVASSAHAQKPSTAPENLFRLEIVRKAPLGIAKPTLTVSPLIDATSLSLRVICGPAAEQYQGPLLAGDRARLVFDVPVGNHECFGQLLASFADGSLGDVPLDFQVSVTAPVEIIIQPTELDVASGRTVVQFSRPVVQVTVGIYDVDGSLLGGQTVPLGNHPANLPLPVRWAPGEGTPFRMQVRAQDTDGFWTDRERIVWRRDFAAPPVRVRGSKPLRRRDVNRLDAIRPQIDAAFKAVPVGTPLKLFIVAHSDDAAVAMAEWFAAEGYAERIRYRVGEDAALFAAVQDERDSWMMR
ncbi:MAG: hypothetical protein AAFV53_25350 [Myxococcota bacterium]